MAEWKSVKADPAAHEYSVKPLVDTALDQQLKTP
ncbi:hypothetical protein QF032_006404 [Streptomyces achromogenes]|nr:hypothetical protein [Streptomyces achromogenes]